MVAEPQEYQYNAEYPIVTGDMDETVIITYSPKYKAYQQKIREGQIQRAMKMMQSPGKSRKGKNPNDPARFICADGTSRIFRQRGDHRVAPPDGWEKMEFILSDL